MKAIRQVVLPVLSIAVAFAADAQQATSIRTGSPELKAIESERRQITVPIDNQILGSVNVWGDRQGHYYMEPYVSPDWAKFGQQLDQLCKLSTPESVVTASLPIEFDSLGARATAFMQLQDMPTPPRAMGDINPYPYLFIRIYTGGDAEGSVSPSSGEPEKTRRFFPTPTSALLKIAGQQSNVTYGANAIFLNTQQVAIQDSCRALQAILADQSLKADMFVPWELLKTNIYSIELTTFATSQAFEELAHHESATGAQSVVQQTSGGSAGFNFGVVYGGGGSGSSTTTYADSRRRAISGSLIQHAIDSAQTSLKARYEEHFHSAEFDPSATRDLLFKAATGGQRPQMAHFEQNENNQTVLLLGEFKAVLSRADVDLLVDTSSSTKVSGKESVAGEYAGIKGSDSKEGQFEDDRKIKWEKKGQDWVPTSVELYVTSFAQLTSSSNASFSETQATEEEGLLRRPLLVVQTDRSNETQTSFRRGWSEAFITTNGPEKLIVLLPASLGLTPEGPIVPELGATPYGRPVFCARPRDAMQQSLSLNSLPAAGLTREGFAKKVGCISDSACYLQHACEMFFAQPNCYVNANWSQWYANHLRMIGALGGKTDGCAKSTIVYDQAGLPVPPLAPLNGADAFPPTSAH